MPDRIQNGEAAPQDDRWGVMTEEAIQQMIVLAREMARNPGHGSVTFECNRDQGYVDVVPHMNFRRKIKDYPKRITEVCA